MPNAGRLTGRLVGRQPVAFARSDSQQEPPGTTRKINGRACVKCHQRKVRCDILTKGPPCSNCQSQQSSSCRYYEKKKSRAALARHSRGNVAIQPRGHQVVTAPTTPVGSRNPWPDDPVPPTSQTVTASVMATASDTTQPRHHQRHDCQPASSSTRDSEGEGVDEQDTHGLAEFIDTQAVRVTEITENSRTYFIGTEFSNLNYLVQQRSHHANFHQLHFGSQHHARKLSRVPSEALDLPEKALTDELVQAYFTYVNPGWPIVDEEDFMAKYNSSPDPRETVKLPLLHAILLVGAHASAPHLSNYRELKAQFLHRAKLLIDSRFEEDRRLYVQVALLLTWSCDSLEDIVSNSWYWVGFAARTALGLGMHRDASQSRMLPIPKREWIRLWWVLVQFDVMIATAYGKPQAINLDESDTPALQEHDFEGVPRANVAFVIEHTRLCVIFSKSMSKILALRATPAEKAEARRNADEDLARFMIQLPDNLRLPLPEAGTWQSFLHLNYNHFLILLHRPPPRQNPRQELPEAASDLKICGDAVVVITSIFESLRNKGSMGRLAIPIMYTLFTALVHVSTDLNSVNPLVIAKSMRMLDSLLISLRELSHHWLFAHSLLRLFEQRVTWDSRQGHRRKLQNGSATEPEHRPADGPHIENAEFSLRPNPTNMPNVNTLNPSQRQSNTIFTPSSITTDQGTNCADSMNTGLRMGGDVDAGSSDMLQRLPYSENFTDGDLNMSPDGLSMMPFPLALDFLLTGMGNEYECL